MGRVGDESPSGEDQELVARICNGDAEALARLYERHGGSAFALALGILRQREAAEDAVQEAFLAVWRRAVTYHPERGTVRAWLLTIVRNRAIDLLRRPSDAPRAVPVDTLALATVDDPEEEGIRAVDGATVRAALARLPAEQRQVVELAYFTGLTYPEVASRTGVALGTVKSRMRLALERLRALLAEGVQESGRGTGSDARMDDQP